MRRASRFPLSSSLLAAVCLTSACVGDVEADAIGVERQAALADDVGADGVDVERPAASADASSDDDSGGAVAIDGAEPDADGSGAQCRDVPSCEAPQRAYDEARRAAANAQLAEALAAEEVARTDAALEAARRAATAAADEVASFLSAYLASNAPGLFSVGSNPAGWTGVSGASVGSIGYLVYFDETNPGAIETLIAVYGTAAYQQRWAAVVAAAAVVRAREAEAAAALEAHAAALAALELADAAAERARAALEDCLRRRLAAQTELLGSAAAIADPLTSLEPLECPPPSGACDPDAELWETEPRSLSDANLDSAIAALDAMIATLSAHSRDAGTLATGAGEALAKALCDRHNLEAERSARRAAVAALVQQIQTWVDQQRLAAAWGEGRRLGTLLLAINAALPWIIAGSAFVAVECAALLPTLASMLTTVVQATWTRVAAVVMMHPRTALLLMETVPDIVIPGPASTLLGMIWQFAEGLIPWERLSVLLRAHAGSCPDDLEAELSALRDVAAQP